jgi:hypothetical protein
VNLRLGKHQLLGTPEPETKTRFTVKVGVNTYELTGTGVECIECKITNGAANSEKAMAEGKIKFTGVTVMQPSPECQAAGGTITTNLLKAQADYMHENDMHELRAYVKFEPQTGPANAFGGGGNQLPAGSEPRGQRHRLRGRGERKGGRCNGTGDHIQ